MTSHLSEYVKERLGLNTAFVLVAYSETNGKAVFHNLRANAAIGRCGSSDSGNRTETGLRKRFGFLDRLRK
jgi:hypothetical protein